MIDWHKVKNGLRRIGDDDRPAIFRQTVCNPVTCSVACDQNVPANDYHNCLYWDQFNAVIDEGRLQEMLDGR